MRASAKGSGQECPLHIGLIYFPGRKIVLYDKLNRLLPVGLLLLAAGLILHNFAQGRATNFTAGFLIGMSLVFLIAGVIKGSRFPNR